MRVLGNSRQGDLLEGLLDASSNSYKRAINKNRNYLQKKPTFCDLKVPASVEDFFDSDYETLT